MKLKKKVNRGRNSGKELNVFLFTKHVIPKENSRQIDIGSVLESSHFIPAFPILT